MNDSFSNNYFFNFNVNANEKELNFFLENINLIENNDLEKIVLNNWFQVVLYDSLIDINSFNINQYMKLYKLRPEIIYSINKKIESQEIDFYYQDNLKKIYELIRQRLILENF